VVASRGGGTSDRHDDAADHDRPTRTTTVPPSTTAAAATSTTTYSRYATPPLPAAAGVVVYESTNDGDVLRIDLATGDVQRRYAPVAPRVAGPWSVIGRQGGYVLSDGSYDERSPIYGVLDGPDGAAVPIAAWSSVDNGGTIAPRAMAAAEPDEVWAWNDASSGEPVTIKRVRLDGTVTAGPVTRLRDGVRRRWAGRHPAAGRRGAVPGRHRRVVGGGRAGLVDGSPRLLRRGVPAGRL
jgi:hypothetical protein